ncbi:hypothetical protein BX666DRAFT_1666496 [Dichotomocladium elegans]|nr:hypothetical protein BX666DRAFT_1666496 [Dichotomocladium elegans]
MTHIFEQPMLSLSPQSIYRIPDVDIDDLSVMWNVFTKCKAHLENGQRLENMSWRLWYHERQQSIQQQQQQQQQQHKADYFSYIPAHSSSPQINSPVSSTTSSSSDSTSSTSIKRFLLTLSPAHDVWSHQNTMTRSESSNNISHSSANDASVVANLSTDGNHKPMATKCTALPSSHTSNIIDTEQTFDNGFSDSQDRQERRRQQRNLRTENIHQAILPVVATSTSIIVNDDDDDDDDDDGDGFIETEYENEYHFEKTEPHRPPSQPSLLSTMLQQRQQLATRPAHIASLTPTYTKHSDTRMSQIAPAEHFLRKELSESLRRNVLWEHIQQRTLYPRNVAHRRPKWRHENNSSDHPGNGWQETRFSFYVQRANDMIFYPYHRIREVLPHPTRPKK